VERIVPLVLQYAADAKDDDELREHCLQVTLSNILLL
jgi:hypothetical protein